MVTKPAGFGDQGRTPKELTGRTGKEAVGIRQLGAEREREREREMAAAAVSQWRVTERRTRSIVNWPSRPSKTIRISCEIREVFT